MCSLQRNYDVIRNWERFETGPLTVPFVQNKDCCGRPWPAAYINIIQNTHQIQVLTEALCRAQAIFYSLPNNEWGTKYRGLTYSAKLTVREICMVSQRRRQFALSLINAISISFSKKLVKVKRPKVKTSSIGKECKRTSHQ